MNKLSKRFLSLFLILAILMSINVPAFASVTENVNVGDSEIVLGEKNVTIEPNAIIIDGVTVTKAEFIAALSSIAKMQNSPQTTRLYEYSKIASDNARSMGALVGVGVGIYPVFATVAFTLFLVTILASMDYPAFVIPAGVFEGIDRTLNVVFTAETVIIDGIVMGLNWVSYELAQYVSQHIDEIFYSEDELTQQALAERDRALEEIRTWSSNKRNNVATVAAGYNKKTGKVAVGIKISGVHFNMCAEDLVVESLGGIENIEYIVMTPAIRPRKLKVIPVCTTCQSKYPRSSFIPGTPFEEKKDVISCAIYTPKTHIA